MLECIGKEVVNFKDKEGKEISFTKLHCTYEANKIDGYGVITVNCGIGKANHIEVGDSFEPLYNRLGKIQELRKVE